MLRCPVTRERESWSGSTTRHWTLHFYGLCQLILLPESVAISLQRPFSQSYFWILLAYVPSILISNYRKVGSCGVLENIATAYLCIKSLKKNWHCKLQWCLPLTYVTPSFFRAWGSQTQNVHHFHPKFSSILPVRLKSTCSQATRMEQLCTTEPAKRSLKNPGISKGNLSDQRIQEWTNIKQWNNVKSCSLSTSDISKL